MVILDLDHIEKLSGEIWKKYTGEITEFHGLIYVSNKGRIFKKGTNTSKNNSKILKNTKTNNGYMKIRVSIDGKIFNKAVHRLVAETFLEKVEGKNFVDHINAIRDDNNAANLR